MAALNDDDLVDYEEEEAPKPPEVNSQQSITSLVNSMNVRGGLTDDQLDAILQDGSAADNGSGTAATGAGG